MEHGTHIPHAREMLERQRMDVTHVQVHLVVPETELQRQVEVEEPEEMEEVALELERETQEPPQEKGELRVPTEMEEEVEEMEHRPNLLVEMVAVQRDQVMVETKTPGMEEPKEMEEEDHQINQTPKVVEDVQTVFLKHVLMLVLGPMLAFLENVLLVALKDVNNNNVKNH